MSNRKKKKKKRVAEYLGYNFTCPIQGNFIPQRLQNLCIRDYAKQKNLVVTFNVAEWWDPSRALMLFTQFDHTDSFDGFVFFSLTILPANPELRKDFYRFLKKYKKKIYFALEDLFAESSDDLVRIERMYLMSLHSINTDSRVCWIENRK